MNPSEQRIQEGGTNRQGEGEMSSDTREKPARWKELHMQRARGREKQRITCGLLWV